MKSLRLLAIFALSLFSINSVFSQAEMVEKVEANGDKSIIPYEKWKLPNGLTILMHQDHSDPVVHVEVTYHVGSARETPGMSGFAHFFEHMMFQGSDHVADEEHFGIVNSVGGTMNGTTNRDRTNYFETVPSNYLETMLWLEADRMGFLLDAVTIKKFENQRATVKNEKGQNYLNQPYGTMGEIKDQNLYGPGHPYSWPTIGYTDDLDSSTVEDLKNFFLRWYGPDNAILTIAGDFNKQQALDWVNKYYGSIPAGQKPVRRVRLDRPILASDQYATIEDAIYFPRVQFVYSSVPLYHRDEPALDMLSSIMGGDNNSLFYKNLVKTEKAIQAAVYNPCFELAGEFTIDVLAYPSENPEDIDKEIRKTIEQFETEVLTGPEIDAKLQMAKANMTSNLWNVMSTVQSKASQLTSWEMLMPGRKFNLNKDLARYNAVTKEDLLRVFNKYIKNKKAAVTYVVSKPYDPSEDQEDRAKKVSFNPYKHLNKKNDPEYDGLTYVKAKDDFDRSKRPAPQAAIKAKVPEYYKAKFDNGLEVIGTQFDEFPKVSILIELKGGHLLEGDLNHGVGALTANLMNEGTEKYTTEEMTAELAKLGSTINFSSNSQSTNVFVQCLTENLDKTLELLEQKLLHPRFDADEFKRVKKETLQSIKNQRTSASLIAWKAFNNLMYGNTILGSFYTGDYKSVDKCKLEDVKAYYNMAYSPSVTGVVVVGPVAKDDILNKMDFLKNWENKEVKLPEITDYPKYEGPQLFLIDRPGAPQSEIRLGHLSNKYDYKEDYFKSNVMNYKLGGSFNSRINLNLREDKGYTYGARSSFMGATEEYKGAFVASAGVRTSATDSSITEFMKEINLYREEGVTQDELNVTKSSLLQRNVLNYESPFQKARFLGNILDHNLPDDYISQQEEVLNSLTVADIKSIANKEIRPEEMIILVVGNSYVVKDKLEKLGYGKVKELDAKNINLKEFKK